MVNTSQSLHEHRLYAINNIILQTFFHADQWERMQAEIFSKHHWTLSLPEIHVQTRDDSSDIILQENFRETIQAIKNGEVLVRNAYGNLIS